MSNSNVFTDFGEWAKTAKLRNPDTNLDEVRMFVLAVLYGVTLYILGTGLYYHYEIFSIASDNARLAITVAVILFVIGEFGKIKFFNVLMWGIYSGDIARNWRKLSAYLLISVFVAGAYYWSWNISTDAAPTLNGLVNKSSKMGSIGGDSTEIKDLENELAALSIQIDDAKAAEKKGFGIKYRGVTTQDGQKIANKNADVKVRLIAQQAEIRATLTAARGRLTNYKETQFNSAAAQLGEYGGYGELAQILLCLINSLILFEMYVINKKKTTSPTASTATAGSATGSMGGFSAAGAAIPTMAAITPPPVKRDADTGIYMYIPGYIKVSSKNKYYEPVQFINWLRNSYKRGMNDNINSLRGDLLHYLKTEKEVSPKIADFCKKYPDIVGANIVNTINTGVAAFDTTQYTATNIKTAWHESGHFVCYAYFNNVLGVEFQELSMIKDSDSSGRILLKQIKCNEKTVDFNCICIMGGFAAEYTHDNAEAGEAIDRFFKKRVESVSGIEGSDTYKVNKFIKEFNADKTAEEYFYDAVDILVGNQALLKKTTVALLKAKTINEDQLNALAKEVQPVEGFDNA